MVENGSTIMFFIVSCSVGFIFLLVGVVFLFRGFGGPDREKFSIVVVFILGLALISAGSRHAVSFVKSSGMGEPVPFSILKSDIILLVEKSFPETSMVMVNSVDGGDQRIVSDFPVVLGEGMEFTKKNGVVFISTRDPEEKKEK